MYFTDHRKERGRGKGRQEGAEVGRRTTVREATWGELWTLNIWTSWESLDWSCWPQQHLFIWGAESQRRERSRRGRKRVPVQVDGRGPGFWPSREPGGARGGCAPRIAADPRRGLAGVGKVCAHRNQLVALEGSGRGREGDESCRFLPGGRDEPAAGDSRSAALSFPLDVSVCLTPASFAPRRSVLSPPFDIKAQFELLSPRRHPPPAPPHPRIRRPPMEEKGTPGLAGAAAGEGPRHASPP